MPNRATVRRTLHRKKHLRPSTTTRAHAQSRRQRGAKLSRMRIHKLHDELNATRDVITDTVRRFWTIPEGDIRDTLAATQHRIGKVLKTLGKAA